MKDKSMFKLLTEEEVCLACVDAAGEEAGAEHSAADLVGAVHLRRDALLRLQEGNFGGLQLTL